MTTRIHHLNCASLHPIGSLGGFLQPAHLVAHVLLVEGATGLTLVDTGFGTADIANPKRLGTPFVKTMRPALSPAETAVAQVEALGFSARDVTDIVLTHLDLDHAGGIGDFPEARVHVYGEELTAARQPRTLLEKRRYISAQWSHNPNWVTHEVAGEDWYGFGNVSTLGDHVRLVPLSGHTRGHCGVAVSRPEVDGGGWLLHAGDSYFYTGEKQTPPARKPGLTVFQKVMAMDEKARVHNQERLRELHRLHGDEVTIFSAHDITEYDALRGLSVR